ncbi:glucose-6-phosphate dehydrogenase (coenzyme-F420) [Devosia sp. 2618]|uniref:glucose-6-phosphate dehydrogenase (coenzyme-F420) n=1 Tax=Devosia sp. 2618 TaxID=3156454 RepID=UPI00339081F3
MLKLGYKASAEQFGPRELLDFSILAEKQGFDSVFVSDHFQPWRHSGGHAPMSLAWLGALAARTDRVQIGTSVLTATFRYHPSVVAQAFGTIGALAPGRIILGIGTGESLNEVPAIGIEWPDAKERFARLREAVTLIRKLWSEERVTFEGEFYRTENATIYDRPEEMVPIYIACAGPMISKYAGRVGDGLICTSGKPTSLYTETLLPNLLAGQDLAGRPSTAVERMIEIKLSYDDDLEAAQQNTRFWAALGLSPEEKLSVEDPLEMQRLADALPIERAAKRWIVTTDPAECVERVRPYVEMGFTHLVFHAPGHDQSKFLQLFARDVAPALRKAFG